MDKRLVMKAFEKMQKREHFLRVARERWAHGRMTREAFRAESAAILQRFALTEEEARAYEQHNRVTDQRKRR